MIVSIAVAAAALIVGIITAVVKRDGSYVGKGCLVALWAGIFLLISALWSEAIPIDKCEYSTTDTPIISLRTDAAADGAFFLGTGRVDNDIYYYYMAETDAGYQMNKVRASRVYVRESNEVPPHLSVMRCTGFIHWYDYLLNVPGNVVQIVLYVPENTIYQHFEIK
jgi:hypothetical protein